MLDNKNRVPIWHKYVNSNIIKYTIRDNLYLKNIFVWIT